MSELVSRLTLLAGPHGYLVTARLVQDASSIELKAVREGAEPDQEFVRSVTLTALEHLGAAVVAREFARDARNALSGGSQSGARNRIRPARPE